MSQEETIEWKGKKYKVIDKRKEGFYCIDCGKFSKDCIMSAVGLFSEAEDGSTIIFKHDIMGRITEVWRVYLHYDGCYGWD